MESKSDLLKVSTPPRATMNLRPSRLDLFYLLEGEAPAPWIGDVEEAEEVLQTLQQMMSRSYPDLFGNQCFINSFKLSALISGTKIKMFEVEEFVLGEYVLRWHAEEHYFKKNKKIVECINQIQECLHDKYVSLVNISLELVFFDRNVGHLCALIINKHTRTVELYDSNGWKFSEDAFPRGMEKIKELFLQEYQLPLEDFEFVPLSVNNPKYGFQVYQGKYRNFDELYVDSGGMCTYWSFYISFMRVEWYEFPPREFKHLIEENLRIFKEHLRDDFGLSGRETTETLGYFFSRALINFLLASITKEDLRTLEDTWPKTPPRSERNRTAKTPRKSRREDSLGLLEPAILFEEDEDFEVVERRRQKFVEDLKKKVAARR